MLPRLLLLLALAVPAAGHGGVYRGPWGGGAGGGASGGGFEGTPAGPAPLGAVPLPTGPLSPGSALAVPQDLTRWEFWWEHNQAPFLALKTRVRTTGSATGVEGFYLGDGQRPQQSSLGPTDDQLRQRVVPALLAVLARESNVDLVTGAMVALAKIGDLGDPTLGAEIEAALLRRLGDASQETRETAAVALGILASPRTVPTLAHLLWDTPEGRKLARASEVVYRTRAFAAYGLGLVGARATSEVDRQLVVSILRRALEGDRTSTRDLGVACVLALGLVPLATLAPPAAPARGRDLAPPESSRQAQLDFVLALFRDPEGERLVRAQCPVTLARLLAGLPEPHLATYRAAVAGELLECLSRRREESEVVQSAVLALGTIGCNDSASELDARIRRVLAEVPRQVNEPQARAFALLAAAEAAGRYGAGPAHEGIDHARAFLVEQMIDGRNWLQPWAALATGVLAWHVQRTEPAHPALAPLRRVLRDRLEDERQHEALAAHALGAGLARSQDCAGHLMKLLRKGLPDATRGQVALGLGLLGHADAVEPLRALLAESKYRPELLRLVAIALGLLGDKDVGAQLAGMLAEARSLAAQAAIASALGHVGDRRALDPLLALLESRLATERARAFAAVALGNVCDKELLPWNAKIGVGVNYRAAPPTLSDPLTGAGILEIF
ncbi:MAG TPA: HEAT repeat domain-containing protein [Planctomycetota bacterium]